MLGGLSGAFALAVFGAILYFEDDDWLDPDF